MRANPIESLRAGRDHRKYKPIRDLHALRGIHYCTAPAARAAAQQRRLGVMNHPAAPATTTRGEQSRNRSLFDTDDCGCSSALSKRRHRDQCKKGPITGLGHSGERYAGKPRQLPRIDVIGASVRVGVPLYISLFQAEVTWRAGVRRWFPVPGGY